MQIFSRQLCYSPGAVTKAILSAGGPSIAKECKDLGESFTTITD